MSTGSKVPEARNLFKQIMAEPERMFELVQMDLEEQCERVVNELLKAELTEFLNRAPYERQNGDKENRNYRNGSYKRTYAAKNIGEVEIEVPRDRSREFRSQLIARYQRKELSLERDIASGVLSGFSTRSVAMVPKALLGTAVSPTEVSRSSAELAVAIEKWRLRDLSTFDVKYLIVDGVLFPMRTKDNIEKVPMLVVIGVQRESNRKVFLTIQQGTKDSASVWREVFKDLKNRGLNREGVQPGIMDGLSALETLFSEEFPKAKIQRCQVHVARNVVAKVPRKRKQEVADRVRDIFYATDRPTAKADFMALKEEYSGDLPSAVRCLETSLEQCLTFYSFPEEEWISLRTTNAIERVNKEFKRGTKPMEILAGERSAYIVLCFVALKLEKSWKSAPLGRTNLPVPQKIYTEILTLPTLLSA